MRFLKFIFKFLFRAILWLRWPLLLLFIAALIAESLLSTVGYPAVVRNHLSAMLSSEGCTCTIGELRGEPFTTLSVNDVRYSIERPEGTFRCWLPASELGLRRRNLLRLQLHPRHMVIKSGFADYVPHDDSVRRFVLRDLELNAELSVQDMLRGYIGGTLNGMRFRINFELQNGSVLLEAATSSTASAIQQKQDSADFSGILETLLGILQQFNGNTGPGSGASNLLALGNDDTSLTINLGGDLAHPKAIKAIGELCLDDVLFRSTPIPKLRATVSYEAPLVRLSNLQCVLPQQELVTASAVFDTETMTASGRGDGSISPDTLLQLCGQDGDLIPSGILMPEPLDFSVTVPEFKVNDLSTLLLNFSISSRNLYIHRLLLSHLGIQGRFTQKCLTIDKASLQSAPPFHRNISAHGEYLLDSNTFSAHIDATLGVPDILNQLGYATRTVLGGRCPETSFSIDIDSSSVLTDWRSWKARATLYQPSINTGPLKWKEVKLTALLSQGTVHLQDMSMQLADAPANCFTLSGETALSQWVDLFAGADASSGNESEAASAFASLRLSVRHGSTTALESTMRLEVTGDDDGDGIALAVHNASADMRPELLHELFNAQLKLPYDEFPLAWETCFGTVPLHTDFTIPQWHPIRGIETWYLEGRLQGRDISLLEVPLQQISADYRVNITDVVFSGIHAIITDAGDDIHIDSIAIQYDPLILTFDNTDVLGEPEAIEPWLYDPDARSVYRSIWEDARWDSEHAPHFRIPFMRYQELPRNAYEFLLRGTAEARNVSYNHFDSSRASCDVELALPSPGVTVSNIRVCAPGEDSPLTGAISVNFDNGMDGNFTFDFPEGEMDIIRLLCASILPDSQMLSRLQLHRNTHFNCQGDFGYNGQLTFSIEGAIQTPRLVFDKIVLDDLRGSWSADNNVLRWNLPQARFFDGELATSGFFDNRNASGECIAAARKIPLDRLSECFQSNSNQPARSVFSERIARRPPQGWRAAMKELSEQWLKSPGDAVTRNPMAPGAYRHLFCPMGGGSSGDDLGRRSARSSYKLKGYAGCDAYFRYYMDWASRPLQLQGSARMEIEDADLWHVPLLSSLGSLLLSSDLGRITKLETDITMRGQRIDFRNILTDGTLISLKGNGNYHIGTRQMKFNISGDMVRSSRFFNWLLSPVAWMVNAELYGTPENFSWHTTTMRKIFSSSADSSSNKLSSELNDTK